MLALSIRQPWPEAILVLGKRVENRKRRDKKEPVIVRHRGPFLIHASAGCTVAEYEGAVEWMQAEGLAGKYHLGKLPVLRGLGGLPRGGIVGRAVAVGVVHPDGTYDLDVGLLATTRDGKASHVPGFVTADMLKWHTPGSYGLIFVDVEPLPFVRCKGVPGRLFEAQLARACPPWPGFPWK